MTASLQILVVDDDPLVRQLLAAQIGALGHRCRVAANGAEAVDALGVPPPPAVALVDLTLPDTEGPELVKALLAADPRLAIILISGGRQRALLSACLEAGAGRFLQKPFDLQALAAAIDAAAVEAAVRSPTESPIE